VLDVRKRTFLLTTFLLFFSLLSSSNRFHTRGLLIALMMEAARTSVTLVNFYHTKRRYNQEDSHLRNLITYPTVDVIQLNVNGIRTRLSDI
jgi:hypothetical protein